MMTCPAAMEPPARRLLAVLHGVADLGSHPLWVMQVHPLEQFTVRNDRYLYS
jgi:hypothetical protein